MSLYGYKPKPKALWFKIKYPDGGAKRVAASSHPIVGRSPRSKTSTTSRPSRRRIASVSTERARRLRVYAGLRKLFMAAHRDCQACQRRGLKPVQFASDVHHTRGKVGQLMNMTEFFLAVCRPCHTWIDANRAEAQRLGLLCEKGSYNTVPKS